MISLTAALFATAALAQEAPPIVNGDRTSDFPQVGSLMAYNGSQGGVFCSGTLIHRKWVLTAAHCLEAADDYDRYNYDVYFMIGTDAYSQTGIEAYEVATDWHIHPDYDPNRLRHDIGVLELANELDYEPIPLNLESPGNTWIGTDLDYVGWGATSDNGGGSGVKRHATIPYYDSDSYLIYAYDRDSNLCSGDSGGAGLIARGEGYEIAGVNSFVYAVQGNTSCVGGGSGATRVDANAEWIMEYVPVEENEPEPEPTLEDTDVTYQEVGDWPDEPVRPSEADEKGLGAGCAVGPQSGGGALALVLGLLALGRRRRP
ncbi:MAG: trypsin-like serine protease [Alphaproteobacteria bacterium]|nr:trypsin-like serine protease [Alphaproteobacteria bacterium]